MRKTIFYHAGCPVCVNAEQELLTLLSTDVEIVNLGEGKVEFLKPKMQVLNQYRHCLHQMEM